MARPAPETLPANSPLLVHSLADGDAWLRHHLMLDAHDPALALLAPERSGADRLLRALQEALVLRYAGEFERSNERLEWADQEAERRYIRSLSETIGSLIVSDRTVSYTPTAGEAAMVPYYRMLNFLSLGELDAAAVESRRVSAILERAGGKGSERCRNGVMLQYLAGLIFEAAGEHNDALVSLRRADEGAESCVGEADVALPADFARDLIRVATSLGVDDVAEAARERYATPDAQPATETGEVLLLIEHGFVAHLTEQAVHVPIFERDIEDLEDGSGADFASAVANVATRLADNFNQRWYWGSAWDDHPSVQVGHALRGAYVLRLAWPAAHVPPRAIGTLRLNAGESQTVLTRAGDLSQLVVEDLNAERSAALARMIGRGIVKYLATREVEKKAEKQGGEFLGFVTGRLANFAANEFERADTRSWTLLPDEISMARISLPPGRHELRVERLSPSGEPTGFLDLGSIEVTAGTLAVVSRRVWSDDDFVRLDTSSLSLEEGPDGLSGPVPIVLEFAEADNAAEM